MNTLTVIVGVFTIIGIMTTIILLFTGSIDKKIEQRINDPEFIKKVASEVRLPFTIIDENNIIQYDSGALEYIEEIDVELDEEKEIKQIIITPKKYMPIAPLIECINSNFEFAEPEKIPQYSWRYFEAKTGIENLVVKSGEANIPLIRKFKITVIK
jgi:hypothetical protein